MPSASSCLLHVFCFAENPYQTESKQDKKQTENYVGIFVIFGRKNQRETVPEGATRQQVHPGLSWAPRKGVDALLLLKES